MSHSGQVLELTTSAFKGEVIDNPKPILIDFWAPWCGPCRAMKPVLAEASQSLAGKVRVASVNVDQERAIAEAFGIRSIPTCVLMQNGKVLDAFVGVVPAKDLVADVLGRIVEEGQK